jgi:E3 ubiquitin-protein ligase DOA10
MTLNQAIAQQPIWVQYWLYVLIFGIVVLPLALLIWRQTRLTAVVTIAASILAGLGVNWVYNKFGYVKLLGLPHIIFWTPLVYYLLKTLKRGDVPVWPTRIISVILAVFVVSLVFDYVDVIRYLFGNRGVSA